MTEEKATVTLLKAAQDHVPKPKTQNISDWDYFEATWQTYKEVGTNDAGENYDQRIIEAPDGSRARLPDTVLEAVKIQCASNANLQRFKVERTGTTKTDTRYTVVPLL